MTSAQRTNKRQDKIWETVKQLDSEKFGKKPRPLEGNPFPKSYRQHALWERDHEPAVLPDDGTRSDE